MLLTRTTAAEFLCDNYDERVATNFLRCRIPAMQADIIRALWILTNGGIYSDLSFAPRKVPDFHVPGKELTVVRWHHGRIVNGIFSALKNSKCLQIIADQIMVNIDNKVIDSIWKLTGPGLWIKMLGDTETDALGIISKQILFRDTIKGSRYTSSTRNSAMHWSRREKIEPLYED